MGTRVHESSGGASFRRHASMALCLAFALDLQAADCNENGIPDEQDLSSCEFEDCNANGIPDECDIARVGRGLAAKRQASGADLRDGAALDLDGDGDLEIAVTQGDFDTVLLFRNDEGTLSSAGQFSTGRQPTDVLSLDWDEDGDMDLLVSNFTSGTLAFHENAGGMSFEPGVDLAAEPLWNFDAMDVDADGDTDLVGAGRYAIFVWAREGGDLAPEPSRLFGDGSLVTRFAALDVDGNALVDIVVMGSTSIFLQVQESPGAFAPPETLFRNPMTLVGGDMDGDGDFDLVQVQSGIDVLLNSGGGSFTSSRKLGMGSSEGLQIVEFSGDGVQDVAFIQANIEPPNRTEHWLVVLHGQGNGILDQPLRARLGATFRSSTAADLDGDGRQDFLVLGADSIVFVNGMAASGLADCNGDGIPNECEPDCNGNSEPDACEITEREDRDRDGNGILDECEPDCDRDGLVDALEIAGGTDSDCDADLLPDSCALVPRLELDVPASLLTRPSPYEFELADPDGDGDLDILAVNAGRDGGWGLLRNEGSRRFSAAYSLSTGAWTREVELSDLDLDLDPDLLTTVRDSSKLLVRRYECGTWSAPVALETGTDDFTVMTADLVGDAAPEAVISRSDLQDALVLPNSGGVFGEPLTLAQPGLSRDVRAGDMDGDGDLDLVGWNVVVRNLGEGRFGNILQYGGNGGQPADADLDGDLDLLFPMDGGHLAVSLNRAGSFTRAEGGVEVGDWLHLADIDGDGDVDAVSGAVSFSINDDRGRFRRDRTYGAAGTAPRLADIDGDGVADIAGRWFSGILITWGTGREFHAPRCYPELRTEFPVSGDLDGNGYVDFLGTEAVLWNEGFATFALGAAPGFTGVPALADLDSDGDLDVGLAAEASGLILIENQGSRRFVRVGQVEPGSHVLRIHFQDMNGDGAPDIVAEVPEELSLLQNVGPFAFTPFSQIDEAVHNVVLGDFDGDSDVDIAGIDGDLRDCVLFQNDRENSGWRRFKLTSSAYLGFIEATDLDGDEDMDFVAASQFETHLFENGGGVTPTRQPINGLGYINIFGMTTGDLDGDSLPEVLLLDSSSLVTARSPLHSESTLERMDWRIETARLAVVDVDGDGRHDVVSQGPGGLCAIRNLTRAIARDCNRNLRLDSCDIASGYSPDALRNGIPDECESVLFHRGDADDDGAVVITDAIFLLEYLFEGGRTIGCSRAANANADGEVNIVDPIRILNFLFLGRNPLPYPGPPGEPCGTSVSPDEDAVSCERYDSCAVSS